MNARNFFAGLVVGVGLFAASNSALSWTITENFDSAIEGTKPKTADVQWFSSTKATSQYRYGNGGKSAALSITEGAAGFGEFGAIAKFPTKLKEGEEVWYRVRTYMPPTFDYYSSTFALKFMRVHTAKTDGSNSGYLDLYIQRGGEYLYQIEVRTGMINESFSSLWDGNKVEKGKWETYEVYYKASSKPGSGIARIWKNGKLQHENKSWETLRNSTDQFDAAYLFTYWNGHAPKSQTLYVDDLFITNERPKATDARGNSYIGMGEPLTVPVEANPSPPILKIN